MGEQMFRMTRVEKAETAKAFLIATPNSFGPLFPAAKVRRHELVSREMILAQARAIYLPAARD
jgi:hypothetical protein